MPFSFQSPLSLIQDARHRTLTIEVFPPAACYSCVPEEYRPDGADVDLGVAGGLLRSLIDFCALSVLRQSDRSPVHRDRSEGPSGSNFSLINCSTNWLTLTPLALAANFSRLRNRWVIRTPTNAVLPFSVLRPAPSRRPPWVFFFFGIQRAKHH
jgi:hypothetical protein